MKKARQAELDCKAHFPHGNRGYLEDCARGQTSQPSFFSIQCNI